MTGKQLTSSRPARRNSLRRQAFGRIALIMVICMCGIASLGLNSFFTMRSSQMEEIQTALEKYYRELIPRTESQWQTEAARTRSRIEMTRVLEEKSASWDRLSAMLNAQWEFISFSNLIILHPSGEILYRYGTEAYEIERDQLTNIADWYLSRDKTHFYRVYSLPIWLGQQGRGEIRLFKNIDSATLGLLAVPNTQLRLQFQDAPIVASETPEDWAQLDANTSLLRDFDTQTLRFDLPWPSTSSPAPKIWVVQRFTSNYPLLEFIRRPIGAILFISLLLVIGLGRWLNRTVSRVEALEQATDSFSATGSSSAAQANLMNATIRNDEVGDLALTLGAMMRDIEHRTEEQKAYLETIALLEEAVLEFDGDGRILHASPGWHALTHGTRGLRATLFEFIHPDDADTVRSQFDAFIQGEKEQATLRMRLIAPTADKNIWVEARFVHHRSKLDGSTTIRGILRDITQVYLHEKQITHMALHDVLTGLPNRVLLEDRVKIALRLARRHNHKVGICFIDLDHFKHVNDTLGHKLGDKLLIEFAKSLERHLRSGDTLARWGGDEFVLLLPEMDSEEAVIQVTNKIREIAQIPLQVDDTTLSVTFSMGVAMFPDDGTDVDTLLAQADRTMFYAKSQGRNQISLFRDIANKGSEREQLYIQNKLAAAIREGQIQAWFQPIVDAQKRRLVGAEVLARWFDADLGWVSPTTFIPMAENMGMICELGKIVWDTTLEAARDWSRQAQPLSLAVNISMRQLFTAGFTDSIIADMGTYSLPPANITLEVTESLASSDVEHAVNRLRELKQAGFHIAIDDFGTGYSSLSQLHDLQVDKLKIDISFVRRINEPSGRSVIQAIIELARALELSTVAEGVEDESTAEQLRNMGATYLQGYHFGKPMPRSDFEQTCLFSSSNQNMTG